MMKRIKSILELTLSVENLPQLFLKRRMIKNQLRTRAVIIYSNGPREIDINSFEAIYNTSQDYIYLK